MASAGRPWGFGSDPPTGSGRARGSPHKESQFEFVSPPSA